MVPKPKPVTSSPFVPEKVPEKTQPPVNAVVPMNIKSRGVLATSEPPRVLNEEITIKTELVIENEFGFGNNNQKITSPQPSLGCASTQLITSPHPPLACASTQLRSEGTVSLPTNEVSQSQAPLDGTPENSPNSSNKQTISTR